VPPRYVGAYMPQHFSDLVTLHTYTPMKMEQTVCSETSAYTIQTSGNYPEESIQQSEHSESLKSRILGVYCEVQIGFLYVRRISDFRSPSPRVRRFVSELLPKRPGFDLRSIRVRFVVDRMTLEHVSLRPLRFSIDSIIYPFFIY